MIDDICRMPQYQVWLLNFTLAFIFMVWERWLGRTPKLRSASTLDLIQNGIAKVVKPTIEVKDERTKLP